MEDYNISEESFRTAMDNSYDVIVNNMSYEGIIAKDGVALFAHDFTEELLDDDLYNMIEYYESLEEYERCAKLLKVLNSIPNE